MTNQEKKFHIYLDAPCRCARCIILSPRFETVRELEELKREITKVQFELHELLGKQPDADK
jgi:hypothetical protein